MSKKQKGTIMVSRMTRGGQVTVPQQVRDDMGLQEGSLLRFEAEGNRIILTSVTLVPVAKSSRKNKKKIKKRT